MADEKKKGLQTVVVVVQSGGSDALLAELKMLMGRCGWKFVDHDQAITNLCGDQHTPALRFSR